MSFKMIGLGRLARDPELKLLQSGKSMCVGSIASDFGFGDHKGTAFLNYVAFGKTAELIHKYLKKGEQVVVEGEYQIDSWTDKNDKKHEKPKLQVSGIQFISGQKKVSGIDCITPLCNLPLIGEIFYLSPFSKKGWGGLFSPF